MARGIIAGALVGGLLLSAACRPPVWRPPPAGSQELAREAGEGKAADAESEAAVDSEGPVLAVRTLEEARPERHREARSRYLEEHGGYTGEAVTRDGVYRRSVPEAATAVLVGALAETGRFSEVRRVTGDTPADADLILTGRLRRLRGWQAYRVEPDTPPRVLESLGDVFLDEVRVVHAESGRTVFLGHGGAMIEELPDAVDPYAAARAAYEEAATRLAERIAELDLAADLDARVSLPEAVTGDLGDLRDALPDGWRGEAREGTVPEGWRGDAACRRLALEDRTRWHFHPRLGTYRPSLELWRCPAGWEGRMHLFGDDAARYPARVIGRDDDGAALLFLSVGESSWPDAAGELVRFLEFTPIPEDPPVLELPPAPATDAPSAPPSQRLDQGPAHHP